MSKLRESKLVSMVATGVVAAFGVAVLAFATTISSNISTGGTLTVTGASTLTGAVSAASTLGVTATSTFTGDAVFNKGVGVGADNSVAKTILISGLATAPDSSAGRIYYNSASKVLQLYDGTQWANIATSTGGAGLDVSGSRLQLNSLNSYLTIGTTTQQGLSMLTLEATSTDSIPLSLVAYNGQTANLLNFRNSSSANLLTVSAGGGVFASSTLQVGGATRYYGAVTVDGASTLSGAVTLGDAAGDAIVLTGNASTTNALTVGSNLYVSGRATTTASSGNFATQGSIVASSTSTTLQGIGVATSTPATEFAAGGSGTTTMYLTTTGASTGACIELQSLTGAPIRIYATTTVGTGNPLDILRVEAGSCK